jgi:hypothetical protein
MALSLRWTGCKMERSWLVEMTNVNPSKDTPILIKQKNLNQVIADPRRESFENWLAALGRAKKLRLRGYEVKLTPPHVGRPPLLLIKTPRGNTGQYRGWLHSSDRRQYCRYKTFFGSSAGLQSIHCVASPIT